MRSNSKIIAVIPARYQSSRFPGKPLAFLRGKTVIQRVYSAVVKVGIFREIIVATDDKRIFKHVKGFGGNVRMTSSRHRSGTDRIAEVIRDIDCEIAINIQGDEPFIDKLSLKKLADAFSDNSVEIASLMHPLTDDSEIKDPNNVKVVFDKKFDSLYFSRSVIPYDRDKNTKIEYFKHIGVYAFKKKALLDFVNLNPTALENTEKLEQLRLLENGYKIRMVETDYCGLGIDTKSDLLKAEKMIKE